ncbi:hypothetical protein GCM10023221_04390 [Luteimicrobium xylanilyticum]|uniref:Uncharacterized protein n=1 Tax=Luteimicrobium xylanilyticum TaxID=1133546 RepID=A0A5P9Q763_9MICO|nr:hypothetical protein [Luteimicrobium xylanilyticum]QFU97268.1 hypothetical protein KDY119_00762 [Luteimicrobium xylanilyticum]
MSGDPIAEALATIRALFEKYGISKDLENQAKRLVRERFSENDYDTYRDALKLLDAAGAIG